MRAAPLAPACTESADRSAWVSFRPECSYPYATHFWRWPGNVVWVPTEAGLGSCHDEEVWMPAASPECGEPRIVHVDERGGLTRGPAEPGSATVVHLGHWRLSGEVTRAALREAERVMAERSALLLHVTEESFSPEQLAPFAERIVALRLVLSRGEHRRTLDLSRLPALPHLRTLSVEGETTVTGVASLSRHAELRGLDLHVDLSESERRAIGELRQLSHLSVTGDVASELPSLTALRWLRVAGTHRNLRAARRLPLLDTLVLGEMERGALQHLRRMAQLRTLSVGLGPHLDVGAIGRARRLRTLMVRARARLDDDVLRWLERAEPLTAHPNATIELDVDEDLGERASLGAWRTVACRAVAASCDPDAPPGADATAPEVDRLLE